MNRVALPAGLTARLHPPGTPPDSDGWNRDDLADLLPGRGHEREAAVVVGLVPRAAGTGVLLTRRTDRLRLHGGQVSFPGGGVEPGDRSALDAALREAHEEIGLERSQARPLGWLDPILTISGFRVLPLVAGIDPGFVPHPDPGEVADVFEVDLDFLLAPENLSHRMVDYAGRPRTVLEYRGDPVRVPHRIWGVTAAILLNLRERVGAAGRIP